MAPTDPAAQPIKPLFPKLAPGPRRMPDALVVSHQTARLEGAMVEAVARHGYAGTTLRELVGLAGVSKTTFYEHFESKEACFLATFDTIISLATEQVEQAFRRPGNFDQRLEAALTTFMDLVVAEPVAAKLATVESLTLGAAGVAHRESGSEAFELMVRQSFEHSGSERTVDAEAVRAITAGLRGTVYRRLRVDKQEELPGMVGELVSWALGYQRQEGETVRRAVAAAAKPRPEGSATGTYWLDWAERPGSRRSRAKLTQRERIARAAARLVIEKGFEALSIPAISSVSGTSNQTFYEHFSSKREAFLAAFDDGAAEGLAVTMAAFDEADDWPEAVGRAVRAILEYVAENEPFARITFFDLQTAGPVALDHADLAMDSFTAFLRPDLAPADIEPISEGVMQAIGSGLWAVIQYEINEGRLETLPDLAPELTRIALMPFDPGHSSEAKAAD